VILITGKQVVVKTIIQALIRIGKKQTQNPTKNSATNVKGSNLGRPRLPCLLQLARSDNSEYEISPSAPSKLPPLRCGDFSFSRNVRRKTRLEIIQNFAIHGLEENKMDFIKANIEWIFSGIGVFILSFFITRQIIKKKNIKQKIGDNSTGIQVGGNFNIGVKDESKDRK
jgi:hypothetical protein